MLKLTTSQILWAKNKNNGKVCGIVSEGDDFKNFGLDETLSVSSPTKEVNYTPSRVEYNQRLRMEVVVFAPASVRELGSLSPFMTDEKTLREIPRIAVKTSIVGETLKKNLPKT